MDELEDTLEAFTDGSSLPHPRRGGIGIRFVAVDKASGEEVTEDISPPGYKGATNQEMELLACTKALRIATEELHLPGVRRLIIKTDSDYLFSNYKKAIFEWPKTQWYRRSRAPVENAEDWEELARWYKKAAHRFDYVDIKLVKGHSNDPHNVAADRLAKHSARNAFNEPRKVVNVRRKTSEEVTDRGSVRVQGQTMTIRVTQSGILNKQKLWKLTYEVLSQESPYVGKRDVIICDKVTRLDAGHVYEIRVNDDMRNPRVLERLREFEEDMEQTGEDEG